MIAIETKYLGPTNTKGARIKAIGGKNSITVSFDCSAKTVQDAHRIAAEALVNKMEWPQYPLIGGGTRSGCVFVFNTGD
jgi:hypothetical protein